MNTKNIKELEEAQNDVVTQWKATLIEGIIKSYVNTEDSMPWTTIKGNFDKESGLKFAQELADAMDINILLNRIENWYVREETILHLVYDIDPNNINSDFPVINNANLDERYGIKIVPQLNKKPKI